MLIITSLQDHVVEPVNSDVLADAVTGPVERLRLERSYHVATLDYDKDLHRVGHGGLRPQGHQRLTRFTDL